MWVAILIMEDFSNENSRNIQGNVELLSNQNALIHMASQTAITFRDSFRHLAYLC